MIIDRSKQNCETMYNTVEVMQAACQGFLHSFPEILVTTGSSIASNKPINRPKEKRKR